MKKVLRFAVLAATVFAGACSKPASGEKSTSTSAAHVHVAPHGGTLVELGDHAYNVEFLRDRAAGKLTAWVLDAHAENFLRLKLPSFQVIAMPGGRYTPLVLQAVANSATGETVGDTSQFEVQADFLKTAGAFSGIFMIEINGTKFEQVAYALPE
jgi:hypothetical protein